MATLGRIHFVPHNLERKENTVTYSGSGGRFLALFNFCVVRLVPLKALGTRIAADAWRGGQQTQ